MKVKLQQPRATDRGPQQIGQEITVPDDEGARMIERGQAEHVKDQPKGGNAQRQ